jgi:di/tricarboxylate transporter
VEVPTWVPFGVSLSSRQKKVIKIPEWYPNIAILIFLGVTAFAMAEYPLHIVCGVAVILVVLLKVATVQEALDFVNWRVYVAASMASGCGRAVVTSGLAAVIADGLVQANVSGFWMLFLFHLVTALAANVVGNVGVINVMFPIVYTYCKTAGIDPLPGAIIIANAALSGLLTPYGTTVTLVIAGTGQYTPLDFVKLGLPVTIWFAITSTVATAAVYNIW